MKKKKPRYKKRAKRVCDKHTLMEVYNLSGELWEVLGLNVATQHSLGYTGSDPFDEGSLVLALEKAGVGDNKSIYKYIEQLRSVENRLHKLCRQIQDDILGPDEEELF